MNSYLVRKLPKARWHLQRMGHTQYHYHLRR